MIRVKELPYAPREFDSEEEILFVETCCGSGDNPRVDVSMFKNPAVLRKETFGKYYGLAEGLTSSQMKGRPYTHQFFIGELR